MTRTTYSFHQPIREAVLADADVIRETIPNTLWRLQQRGLVASRQHDADKRFKEYPIGEAGARAVSMSGLHLRDDNGTRSPNQQALSGCEQRRRLPYESLVVRHGAVDDARDVLANLDEAASVNEGPLSSTMWRLDDRDLVASLSRGQRYNEYRLTAVDELMIEHVEN